jgi:hypothetical protein
LNGRESCWNDRQFHGGHLRCPKAVQAKDLAQHIVSERRPVSRLDILHLLAANYIPFS